jgi:hypothetical protein
MSGGPGNSSAEPTVEGLLLALEGACQRVKLGERRTVAIRAIKHSAFANKKVAEICEAMQALKEEAGDDRELWRETRDQKWEDFCAENLLNFQIAAESRSDVMNIP